MTRVFETNDFSHLEVPSHDTIFGTTMPLAEGAKQLQNGNLTGARTIWRDALEKHPGNTDRASFLLMIGLSYFMEGNIEQATVSLTEGTAIQEAGIDDVRSEDMVISYLGDQRVYYDALIECLVFGGKVEQSFEVAERARARAFLRLLGNRRLKPPSGSGSAVVQQAEELRRKIDHWDREPQPDTTLADLRQQYEGLRSRVQVFAGEYASITSVPAQQIDAVRKELPENTTLLSYFVTPFSAHAWILDKETLEHVRLNVSESTMRRISCWAFELARPRSGRPAEGNGCGADPADPAEAYAALIAPLRSKIRKKRLMIVPHGELHYVPFAALYDEKRKRYLVEDYPIMYVPSASTIRFLREKDSPVGGGALVLGDPVTAGLPGAGREARSVARKLRTTAKLGEEAQESLLYRLDGKIDLLHIAAHGTYDAASPLFSAVHLAEGDGENGQLNVDEIQSRLDLSGVNLVVLSACQSGVGKRRGGDEIIGLTRSILYAGSPGVIATLMEHQRRRHAPADQEVLRPSAGGRHGRRRATHRADGVAAQSEIGKPAILGGVLPHRRSAGQLEAFVLMTDRRIATAAASVAPAPRDYACGTTAGANEGAAHEGVTGVSREERPPRGGQHPPRFGNRRIEAQQC